MKKQGDKKLLFFKSTPEKVSFISKLYFPFKIIPNQDTYNFFLSTSFFNRSIKNYKIDKNELDNNINDILKDGITIEDLKRFNELLGKKGFFGKLVGKEKENYTEFQVMGGYPEKYPNNLLNEFKFIQYSLNLQKDGIIFPQSFQNVELENSARELKFKLDEIDSDIKYIHEKKVIHDFRTNSILQLIKLDNI